MRKLLLSLLLAGAAATPALAAPGDDSDRPTRAERQQAREDRRDARDDSRPARQQVDRPAPVQPQVDVRQQSFARPGGAPAIGGGGPAFGGGAPDIQARRDARRDARDDRADQRNDARQDRIDARDLRQSSRPLPPVMRTRTPIVSDTPRAGTQPPPRDNGVRRIPAPRWSTNWRHDNRYDWSNWRRHHRSLFSLGFYYDPFGWGYQPYSIGWRLWPAYYGSRFWINDPWEYRLPYAPPGTRWVRYYNDAVLVDTWSGQVVDVIYSFFW
jgi:Ni/Co efflux regulator RcnB